MAKEYIMLFDYALYNEETGEAVFNPQMVGELVRCKDCVHRDPEDHGCDCAGHEMLKGGFIPMPDNFYCADGERRTE